MTQLQKYQYATVILGILVIILGGVLIQRNVNTPASDGIEIAQDGLVDCSTKIKDWKRTYSTATSTDAQNELSSILSDCVDDLK